MMKKPDQWMPLNIGHYLRDTSHLTREQHGAYLLLLMAYWCRGGPLPADDGRLAATAKASAKEWSRLRPIMAEFFIERDGHWLQKRAEEELTKAKAVTAAKVEAGKKGAESKWRGGGKRDGKTNGKTMAEPSVCQWQNDAPLPSTLTSNQEELVLKDLALSEQSSADADAPHPKPKTPKGEPEGFSEWYEAFPKHKGRGAARRAYAAARKKTDAATLLAGAIGYAEERAGDDQRFTKMPATWLNAECWRDDTEPKTETVSVVHRERMLWLKEYARDGRWQSNKSGNGVWRDPLGIGPPPHQAGTLVTDADLELIPGAAAMKTKLTTEESHRGKT